MSDKTVETVRRHDLFEMTTLYKTITCTRCNEDDLVITLNKDSNSLYLNCGGCEASWLRPDEVGDDQKMFIDLSINAADPTLEDIVKAGWDKYVTGTIVV